MKLLPKSGFKVAALKIINVFLENRVGKWLIWRYAQKLVSVQRKLGSRAQGTVYLFPHGDSGNRLLHGIFSETLSLRGFPAEVVGAKPRWVKEWQESRDYLNFPKGDKNFESFADAIEFLESFASGDQMLARGIIDEFMRWCPTDFFEGNYRISHAFLEKVGLDTFSARRALADASGVVIGESAYVYNRALVSVAEKRGVPLWVLNTGGGWARADGARDENFSPISFTEISERLQREPDLLAKAKAYVDQRFAGLSNLDLDSANAFSGSSLPDRLRQKKILALHAFRDATQLPIGGSGPSRESWFKTFYEWADFVFSHISDSAEDWAIRPHPSARLYRGDSEILEGLLRRYGLQGIDRADGVSTAAILENRLPVYTHNGTISVETAIFGYRSFVCSNLYPEEITVFTRTKEELSAALSLPFRDATPQIAPEITVDQLTVLLYDRFHPPLRELRPPYGDNRSSPWAREKANFLRLKFYLWRFITQRDKELIRSATNEIVEAVMRTHQE